MKVQAHYAEATNKDTVDTFHYYVIVLIDN